MGFSCTLPGSYTLTASDIESFSPNVNIKLQDLKTNTIRDLRSNPVYTFTYDTTDNPDHFLLIFSNLCNGTGNQELISPIKVYSYNGTVYVDRLTDWNSSGTLFVYDMTGKLIFKSNLRNAQLNKFNVTATEGCYVVRVVTPGQTVNRKVYLN
jgi:hypothetical protein